VVVVVAVAGAALLGGVFWVLLRQPSPASRVSRPTIPSPEPVADETPKPVPPSVRHIDVTTIPAEAGIAIDDGSPWTGQIHTTIPADSETHVLRIWAQGYQPKTISFGPSDRPPAQIRLDPLPNPTASGKRPRPGIAHGSRKTRPAVESPAEEPRGPRRGVNDAFIIE
jgi:hypothetical protein